MLSAPGCSSASSGSGSPAAENSHDSVSVTAEKRIFNTDSAMSYLKRQVEFGPRVPGTQAHKDCADMIAISLRDMGAKVDDAVKPAKHPVSGEKINVRNIFASFNTDARDRILLVAHYDTRPVADADPVAANRETPIDGANDGASGVAVILEVARNARLLPQDVGLDILFTDLEDSGSSGDDESWCIGSSFWAENLPYAPGQTPRFGILLDMVGGRDAVFMREYYSQVYASRINDIVWETAANTPHAARFPDVIGGAINDDHLPLLRAGIPVIDIIEMRPESEKGFNPTWHTLDDNIDNIDPSTIEAVGDVITKIIYRNK